MESSDHSRGRGQGKGRGRGRGRGRDNRGGRGRGDRNKKHDMGRAEYNEIIGDRRAKNEATKRRRIDNGEGALPLYATEFSKEEIEAQERKPKKKVAVMIGYSGSGYKGMQLNDKEKTIEGDLFKAFVAAGAISKANATDPKKSALVRCARTDKGVHAAGNVISLKLIVEDEDVVKKINDNLSPQIRVWGYERTTGSFSAYRLCDSRIYEYLIPTHCFLPPHPSSFLARKLSELADEADDREGYEGRQKEVATFWEEIEEKYIQPILQGLDATIIPAVTKALYGRGKEEEEFPRVPNMTRDGVVSALIDDETNKVTNSPNDTWTAAASSETEAVDITKINGDAEDPKEQPNSALDAGIKELKAAYLRAKKAYRIHPDRLARVKSALSRFVGTQNYHNYTVHKSSGDASAKRVIKSFIVAPEPLVVGGTEWLSLKVHGQSFMMHQIRKMVSMAALVVRTGCHEARIQDSYEATDYIIPKAPGLGLLLERPVFDSYNSRLTAQMERRPIGFDGFEKELQEFKEREIYDRIFREEEEGNVFHAMCVSIDNTPTAQLLYLSSMGEGAVKRGLGGVGRAAVDVAESEDESVEAGGEDG